LKKTENKRMKLHKLVDALRNGDVTFPIPDSAPAATPNPEAIANTIGILGDIPAFELRQTGVDDDRMTFVDFSRDLFDDGVAHLPFPTVYVEDTLEGVTTAALAHELATNDLVLEMFCEIDSHWFASPFTIRPTRPDGPTKFKADACPASWAPRHIISWSHSQHEWWENTHSSGLHALMVLIGALATPDAIRTPIDPPERLNRKRTARGKTPIPHHTVIDLRPRGPSVTYQAEDGTTRASPRPHWRRSHLRTLPNGRRLRIPPTRVRIDVGIPIPSRYQVVL
jgi:hypothetical protein